MKEADLGGSSTVITHLLIFITVITIAVIIIITINNIIKVIIIIMEYTGNDVDREGRI